MKLGRRNFIKRGALFVPATFGIFVPRLIRAVNINAVNANVGTLANSPGAGGGASAFTYQKETTGSGTSGVTSITFGSSIVAGRLLLVWVGWEDGFSGLSLPNTVTENGSTALTALTKRDQQSGFHDGQWFYKLSANGGGTVIDLTWTLGAECTFCRVIGLEFSYGGTASFVAEGNNGANSGTSGTSGSVTNSGTHRLNICGYTGYNSDSVSGQLIGGSSVTNRPTAQLNTTWTWHNAVNLSTQNSSATVSNAGWIMNLASFAAN